MVTKDGCGERERENVGDVRMRLHRESMRKYLFVVWMDGWMNDDDDDVCKHECMIQLGDNISSKACPAPAAPD